MPLKANGWIYSPEVKRPSRSLRSEHLKAHPVLVIECALTSKAARMCVYIHLLFTLPGV